jgi:hypothetical protein
MALTDDDIARLTGAVRLALLDSPLDSTVHTGRCQRRYDMPTDRAP